MKKLHYISLILTISWMAIIFAFSSQNGKASSGTSGRFVNIIIDIFIPDYDEYSIDEQLEISDTISLIIRKGAHFTEYFILGALCLTTFLSSIHKKSINKTELSSIIKRKRLKWILYSGISSCIYAISDEIHQGFVADRSPAVLDVFIDTAGSFAGAFFAYLFLNYKIKRRLLANSSH